MKKSMSVERNKVENVGLAYYKLGIALRESNNHQEALKAFKNSINYLKLSTPDQAKLAPLLSAIGITYKNLRKLKEAQEAFKRAIELNPKFAEAYIMMGAVLISENNFAEAISFLKKAIKIEPLNESAFKALAKAYKRLGKKEESLEAFKKVIAINPKNALAYANAGDLLRNLGKYNEAKGYYQSAIAIDPKNDFKVDLGYIYLSLKEYADAENILKSCIESYPNCHTAYHYLGDVLYQTKRYDEAEKIFEKAVSLDKKCSFSNYQLSNIKTYLQKSKEALPYIKEAIVSKESPIYYLKYAEILADIGKVKEADFAFMKAIKLDSTIHNVFHNYGAFLIGQKKIKKAIVVLKKSIELDKKCALAHQALGVAYFHNDQFDLAIESLRRSVKIAPDKKIVYYDIGLCFLAKNNEKEARVSYKKALKEDAFFKNLEEAIKDLNKYQKKIPNKKLLDTFENFLSKHIKNEI